MKAIQIKKKAILLAIALMSCYMINAQDVSRYIESFKGNRGLIVSITRYGDYEKKQALVRVSGFDHPWSGLIFLCDVTTSPTEMKETYTTKIDGKDYELMRITKDHGTVWLKGNYSSDITYESTFTDEMRGRNSLVNDYNNSPSKANPR